jgi:hypothetical protein
MMKTRQKVTSIVAAGSAETFAAQKESAASINETPNLSMLVDSLQSSVVGMNSSPKYADKKKVYTMPAIIEKITDCSSPVPIPKKSRYAKDIVTVVTNCQGKNQASHLKYFFILNPSGE